MKTIKVDRSLSNSLPVYLSIGPVSDRLSRAVKAIEARGGAVRVEREDVYVDLPDDVQVVRSSGMSPRFRRHGLHAVRFSEPLDIADDGETVSVPQIDRPAAEFQASVVIRRRIGNADLESVTVLIPLAPSNN